MSELLRVTQTTERFNAIHHVVTKDWKTCVIRQLY